MSTEINYLANPLNGVGLKSLLIEIVDHYGFEILFAYLNINCFKTNPSIESSVIFLKKTEWAREKVEAFYLYKYKNLPGPSDEQLELPPRDRIVPEDQVPGEPVELSLEDAERVREKRAKKTAAYNLGSGKNYGDQRSGRHSSHRDNDDAKKNARKSSSPSRSSTRSSDNASSDPYANWKYK